MGAPLLDEAHSGHMASVDESDAQRLDGIWMTPVSSVATVPRDVQHFDGTRTTPVSSTVTVPRYARDLDGVSPASLQLLLRETAAPAFIGEGLSHVPNPTRTDHVHTRPSPSQ